MSTYSLPSAPPPPPPPPSYYPTFSLANIGLGYALAIALGFLLLLSALLLTSYICCRRHRLPPPTILPRVIFVAEDDDDDDDNDLENPNRLNSPSRGVVGLSQSVINSYPKLNYSNRSGETMCSICLCDYREGEVLRMMPDCKHAFHLLCLDAWLRLSGSCPVCRSSPLPTPLSTPLAEVVPLALFPDNRRRRSS